MRRTFVIAEAAACHDGDPDKAARLIELAADIGADACKFQWVSLPERLVERRRAPEYLIAYRDLAFPRSWFPALKRLCDEAGVEFMVTVYLPEDVSVIAPYVKRFKVASFESEIGDLYYAFARYHKAVLYSTGMDMVACPVGDGYRSIQRLHCVSAYPVPLDQMNLAVLRDSSYVGLSDHSRHPWTGALAVAAGAEVVEFHFRLLDTEPTNADFAVAFEPEEAREYVANIRLAERMLGDGRKRVMLCEEPMLRYRVRS